jgi:regulator of protease activity HflC (stomatin/prohibitin superfamily)
MGALFGFLFFLIIVAVVLLFFSVYIVEQQHCAVIERFGKYNRITTAGIHLRIPIIEVIRRVSLLTQDEMMRMDAKTADNVTIGVEVSVQYHVDWDVRPSAHESGIYKSLYTLADPVGQMKDYFADALRSQIPKYTLDQVFSEKDSIAEAIYETVAAKMYDYGYIIVRTLITSINLPENVRESMNRIVATRNDRESAKNEAEAARQRVTIAAQADAEAAEKRGQGIAALRIAIANGTKESLETLQETGVSPDEANMLFMYTQYIDAMTEFAKSGKASIVVLPSDFNEVQSMFTQMLSANVANKNDSMPPVKPAE